MGFLLLLLLFCPFFTLVALSLPCVRHIIFVTFVYCDIVERCHILKSSSIYSNPCKAATKVLLHPVLIMTVLLYFFFFLEGACLLHTISGDLLYSLKGPAYCLHPRLINISNEGNILVNYSDETGVMAMFTNNGKLLSHVKLNEQNLVSNFELRRKSKQ